MALRTLRTLVPAAAALLLLPAATAAAALVPPSTSPTVLDIGHVDALALSLEGGQLRMVVHDDSVRPSRDLEPRDAIIHGVAAAELPVPDLPDYRFLGPAGSTTWVLQEIQMDGVVWPGYTTYGLDPGQLRGDRVTVRLLDVSGPGQLDVFTSGPNGEPQMIATTRAGQPLTVPTTFAVGGDKGNTSIPVDTHAHMNWAFSKPGLYDLVFQAEAVRADGAAVSTGPVRYRFALGALPPAVTATVAGAQASYAAGAPVSLVASASPAVAGGTWLWTRDCAAGSSTVGGSGGTYAFPAEAGQDGCTVTATLHDAHGVVRAQTAPVTLRVSTAAAAPLPSGSASPTPTRPTTSPTAGATTAPTPGASGGSTAARPALVSRARLSGVRRASSRLQCTASFSGATSVTYGWRRDGKALPASGRSLVLSGKDVGHRIACTATATGPGGERATASGAAGIRPARLVSRGLPAARGPVAVSKVLRASAGRWSPAPTTYRFQWLRDGKVIRGAGARTYRVTAADRGHAISVRVAAHRSGSGWAKAISASRPVQ